MLASSVVPKAVKSTVTPAFGPDATEVTEPEPPKLLSAAGTVAEPPRQIPPEVSRLAVELNEMTLLRFPLAEMVADRPPTVEMVAYPPMETPKMVIETLPSTVKVSGPLPNEAEPVSDTPPTGPSANDPPSEAPLGVKVAVPVKL